MIPSTGGAHLDGLDRLGMIALLYVYLVVLAHGMRSRRLCAHCIPLVYPVIESGLSARTNSNT